MHDVQIVSVAIAAFVAIAGVAVYFGLVYEKKRSAALAEACLRLGFTCQPGKIPPEQAATLGNFHLFNLGHSRVGRNLMTGKADGAAVTLLDYQYVTGGGKSSHTWSQTVAIFPGARSLPEFTLGPEHWWDKVGEIFGHHDIDVEASPEFSKHYLLKGPDETRLRAAFGAEALGFFAQSQGWSVESKDGALAVYRVSKRVKPEELQSFTSEAAAVRRALVHD